MSIEEYSQVKKMIKWAYSSQVLLILILGAILSSTIYDLQNIPQSDSSFPQKIDFILVRNNILQENVTTDFINPIISGPIDISYLVNTTGHNISWYIADKNPRNYSIQHNYQYIETERNNSWSKNQTITYSVDNLPIGIHLFTILVEDFAHNQAYDDVVVMVRESAVIPTFTLPNTSPDFFTNLINDYFTLGLGLTVVILIIILIIGSIRFKRRSEVSKLLPPQDPLELEFIDENDILKQ